MGVVTFTLKQLRKEYATKIMNGKYLPRTPVEALYAYITALWMLGRNAQSQVKCFFDRTSLVPVNLDDLLKKSEKVAAWHKLQLCSMSASSCGNFVEYKGIIKINSGQKVVHRHAQFMKKEGGYLFVSESAPWIRVIGDSILHRPGILFPNRHTAADFEELNNQIQILKNRLIHTGGGGIAANQCTEIESPYQLTIVGVFKENEEHVRGVNRRYPGNTFPPAMVMLNPEIISVSERQQSFYHGCLSVPCSNRFEVASPEEMTVRYINPLDNMKTVTVSVTGGAAVAVWHELNHILDGKTYVDTVLSTLGREQLQQFIELVELALDSHKSKEALPNLSIEPFFKTIELDKNYRPQINRDVLSIALMQMTNDTLSGLYKRGKYLVNSKSERFFSSTVKPIDSDKHYTPVKSPNKK